MADYIYLLETRLSKGQQAAVAAVRQVARDHDLTVFLVGGAIRDLISGAPVRDLDVAVQGNALKLKKDLERAGAEISGESSSMQTLHLRFSDGVRMEISSTLTTSFPKPGRAVAKPATILDDLRRRDFTANAMALSLNDGSYGLLMDPLNGVADIENRELRLVSNYGFIEDPVRLIRAARFMARLGWRMDEKTEARYVTAKEENYIHALQAAERGYETEELFHEEDPLRVMRRLEEEGWLQHLAPSLGTAKANAPELAKLRDIQMQLQEHGIVADAAAANFPLLTAKLSSKEALALRESFPRLGLVREIDTLDAAAKALVAQLSGKQAALPSQAYRLLTTAPPIIVLWTAYTTKNSTAQAKLRSFLTEWSQARQRVPHVLMQEMRITADLPHYEQLLEKLSDALMDGLLETPEATRAFLEPYSPPAPPPPVSLRRPRVAKGAKKDSRATKARKRPDEVDAADLLDGATQSEADRNAEASSATQSPDGSHQTSSIPGTQTQGKPASSSASKRKPSQAEGEALRPSSGSEARKLLPVEQSADVSRNGTAPSRLSKRGTPASPTAIPARKSAPAKKQVAPKKLPIKKKAVVARSTVSKQDTKAPKGKRPAPSKPQKAAKKRSPVPRVKARPSGKPATKVTAQARRISAKKPVQVSKVAAKKKSTRISVKAARRR